MSERLTTQVVERAKHLGIEQGRREERERIVTIIGQLRDGYRDRGAKQKPGRVMRDYGCMLTACDDILAALEED